MKTINYAVQYGMAVGAIMRISSEFSAVQEAARDLGNINLDLARLDAAISMAVERHLNV